VVTVVYSIKDRDPERLRNSIRSIKENTVENVSFIVVDYGSSVEYASHIAEVCKDENVKYIRSEVQGYPWSRAHSLNIGIMNAKSEFVAVSDIDLIFENDIIKVSLRECIPNTVVHGQVFHLPRNGVKRLGKVCFPPNVGAYMFVRKKDFVRVGGFDERIKFWGHEDFDLSEEFAKWDIKKVFIEDFYLYHVWHPISNSFLSDRPEFSMSETLRATMENRVLLKNRKIGVNTTRKDRPILNKIENSKPNTIKINNYEKQMRDILEAKEKNNFLRLVFPKRRKRKFLGYKIVDNLSLFLNKTILANLGYQIALEKDSNFDLFYHSIPILREVGLKDYYLYDGYEKVDILF